MTVQELRTLLEAYPPESIVEVQFDINDHDTTFELTPEIRTNADVVVLVAK